MHHHHHHHDHHPPSYTRAFILGILLNTIFVGIEGTYGYLSGSLALMADAGHNLSDVLGLALAWIASILATKKFSRKYTYGLRSTTILAALTNAIILLVAILGIGYEAIHRLNHPRPVDTQTMIWVSSIGIVVNFSTALFFFSGRKTDLNIKGAFLHMMADGLVSLGVVVSGLIMAKTQWPWIDSCVGLAVALVIFISTWQLLRDSLNLALDAVPSGIEIQEVQTFLLGRKGVAKVHDLHIWGLSTTETALTAHLVMPEGHPGDEFLAVLAHELEDHFQIHHSTVQIEFGHPVKGCKQESGDSCGP